MLKKKIKIESCDSFISIISSLVWLVCLVHGAGVGAGKEHHGIVSPDWYSQNF
jgi:hypothetical protein